MDRIAQLLEILAEHPGEKMARYALAVEYLNAGQDDTAIAEFRKITVEHPDYVPAHQMLAQTLIRKGLSSEARDALQRGIAVASATGNGHAEREMQGMLEELG